MADSLIKPDPDSKSPGVFDEDIYEDAGDLEFNNDPMFQSIYMAKIPRFVWEAWSKLGDDDEIQIGTIRASKVMVGGKEKDHYKMLLSSQLRQHQAIPKEYDLEVIEEDVNNTFVFSEQDLPGYKSKSNQKFDLASANMPSRLTRPAHVQKPKQPYDPNRKPTPYFRKAVPKRTTLTGKVGRELNVAPVDNPETRYWMQLMTDEAMRAKRQTVFIKDDDTRNMSSYIQPGTLASENAFTDFIKLKASGSGSRPQIQKAARIPMNELRDKIFACFKRYKYWSMKALRTELEQPEAYLREALDFVAVLARSGSFTGQWSLKPEYKDNTYNGSLEAAPDTNDSDTGMDDEDDEDVDMKFEDVVS